MSILGDNLLKIASKVSILFVLISLLLVANDNSFIFANQEMSDVEVEKIKEGFCSLGDLEVFYEAEQRILINIDDNRIEDLVNEVFTKHSEPLIRKRAERIIELLKTDNFNEIKKQKYFGLYFSSDSQRRLEAVHEMWIQNSKEAENYLFSFVENDTSYDVKTKAILALADFKINQDKISSFIIQAESSDEELAVASLYVLLNNSSGQTPIILKRWLIEPNYDWQKMQALKFFETSPELIQIDEVVNLISHESNSGSFASYCEILAKKINTSEGYDILDLLKALKWLLEQKKFQDSQSWIKLWEAISLEHDLSEFFKGIINKKDVPKLVWRNIAAKEIEYMLNLAFDENKYIRNLARNAIAQAGLGVELIKKIQVCDLTNESELTLNEIIKHVRLNCHFEIYLSSYSQHIRDAKVHAFFGKCTLYELLAILSMHLDLRFEFDSGRLLVFPGNLTYRGFKIDPIFLTATKIQEYFNTYVTKDKIASQTIPEFMKYMRDLTGVTFISNSSVINDDYKTPVVEKNRGFIPVLTRSLNEADLDLFAMSNALWIIDKTNNDLLENAKNCIKKPTADNFQKLVDSKTPSKYHLISSLLQSKTGEKLDRKKYNNLIINLLESATDKYDISSLIPCLSRLADDHYIVDRLLKYTQSPKYEIRTAAITTLLQSDVNPGYLLTKFIGSKLNAQKIIIEIVTKKLSTKNLDDYFVNLIETGNINDLKLNLRTWSNLVLNEYLENHKPKKLDDRLNTNLENSGLTWLLHLLRIQTRINIHMSPYFERKLSERPGLLKTPLSLNLNVTNLLTALNILFFQLSASAEVKELMPVPKIYEISSSISKKKNEIVIAYPFEFERLIMFQTILRASVKVKTGFEKETFEYIWSLTDLDELITAFNTRESKLYFINEYKNNVKELIVEFEKDRTAISPEFARLFIRLRKMLNMSIPELYKNYKDFPEEWFLPESLKTKNGESDE